MVPHGTVAYIWIRRPERFPAAAARTYAVFDLGAIFYWAIPTAPPWWAAAHGQLNGRLDGGAGADGAARELPVRRMMLEYGEQFWGDRWGDLYDVLGGNPLAAMPSLHFATSLMAAHLLSEVGPVSGGIAFTYAATLGLALVYLGEHYAVDLLAGAALAETVRAGRGPATPAARALVRALHALQLRAANP
jgi:membrane-associated phospholipid phosphatase